MTKFYPFGATTYYLGSSIGSNDSTILLSSFLEPVTGTPYTMVLLNTDIAYGTISPKTTSSEFISFTGITQNANGTATLTGVVRGLAKKYPFTTSAAYKLPHSGQSQFIISDAPQVFNQYAVKGSDETISGQWTFTNTPIVPGTVSDASTTVKGVSKLSVAPAVANNPIAVGDNDPRVASTPTVGEKAGLAGTQGVVSATNKYETKDHVYDADYDQSQTTQNSTNAVGEANATTKANYLAQSFIPLKTKIRGVNLYKSADTGTFAGTVTVSLQADTAGSPSGVALGTVTLTNAQWLAKNTGEFEALFTVEYASMTQGNLYWIVIQTSTSDNSNHINLGTNSAGGYANGSAKLWNATDGWVAIATIDLYFKTLQGVNSQVIQSNTSGKIPDFLLTDGTKGKYTVGALDNALVKTYFNIQLPFILWTGSTNGALTTDFINWERTDSIKVVVPPMGAQTDFQSTSAACIDILAPFYGAINTQLAFSATNIIIIDFWAKLSATNTSGDVTMGFVDSASAAKAVYNDTNGNRVIFAQKSTGELYATISKSGVGVSNTDISAGLTLTNYNNYRIELHNGTDAKFYVNGVLKATLSGANLPSSGSIAIGFGRSNTALFQVTAPTLSLQMNP